MDKRRESKASDDAVDSLRVALPEDRDQECSRNSILTSAHFATQDSLEETKRVFQ